MKPAPSGPPGPIPSGVSQPEGEPSRLLLWDRVNAPAGSSRLLHRVVEPNLELQPAIHTIESRHAMSTQSAPLLKVHLLFRTGKHTCTQLQCCNAAVKSQARCQGRQVSAGGHVGTCRCCANAYASRLCRAPSDRPRCPSTGRQVCWARCMPAAQEGATALGMLTKGRQQDGAGRLRDGTEVVNRWHPLQLQDFRDDTREVLPRHALPRGVPPAAGSGCRRAHSHASAHC